MTAETGDQASGDLNLVKRPRRSSFRAAQTARNLTKVRVTSEGWEVPRRLRGFGMTRRNTR